MMPVAGERWHGSIIGGVRSGSPRSAPEAACVEQKQRSVVGHRIWTFASVLYARSGRSLPIVCESHSWPRVPRAGFERHDLAQAKQVLGEIFSVGLRSTSQPAQLLLLAWLTAGERI